jgi:hypothetical protein
MRYKTVIGRRLHARTLPTQKAEAAAGCKIINVMTRLGMPVSQRITWAKMSRHQCDLHLNYAPKPIRSTWAATRPVGLEHDGNSPGPELPFPRNGTETIRGMLGAASSSTISRSGRH